MDLCATQNGIERDEMTAWEKHIHPHGDLVQIGPGFMASHGHIATESVASKHADMAGRFGRTADSQRNLSESRGNGSH